MPKYINAEEQVQNISCIITEYDYRHYYDSFMAGAEQMRYQIQKLIETEPSADVQEVVKAGRWIDEQFTCPACGWSLSDIMDANSFFSEHVYKCKYCPFCGAKIGAKGE